MPKACLRHKPRGCYTHRGEQDAHGSAVAGVGLQGRVRTANRSRKSSSQVSPGSAPPPAPPRGCSPLALVAKPVLPEWQQSSNCTETHLPECHCRLLQCSSGRAGGEMCHCTTIPLRRPGGSFLFYTQPPRRSAATWVLSFTGCKNFFLSSLSRAKDI